MILMAVTPAWMSRWVGNLNGPLTTLLGPVTHPVRSLVLFLRGPEGAPDWQNPALAQIKLQLDESNLELQQSRRQIDDLRKQIMDLSRGMELVPTVRVKQIPGVPVIGGAGDAAGLVSVRAGKREGVEPNAVAVVRGVHLVGRVRRVDDRVSSVQSILDRSIGLIAGVVMLDDVRVGPICPLEADGTGALVGRLQHTDDPNNPSPQVTAGMLVRLQDSAWPETAQMLILGRVERVEPMPKQPLRMVVTVRPEYHLDRASEVTLRMADRAEASPVGRTGGTP